MTSFIDRYTDDFNRLDAKAICAWYEFPMSVLTPQGNTIFNNATEFSRTLDRLLDMYQSFDFGSALILNQNQVQGKHGLNQLDIQWRLLSKSGNPIAEFDISYFHKEHQGQTRICGVISHNESTEWKKKLTRAST